MNSLRSYREKKGLTQAELAEKMGITRQTVGNWESGAYSPNANEVKELSKILDIDVGELTSTGKENGRSPEAIYRDLVESRTEYRLIHKTILDGEYIIMSKVELAKQERQFDKIDQRTQKTIEATEKTLEAKNDLIKLKEDIIKERDQTITDSKVLIQSLQSQLDTLLNSSNQKTP